MSHPCNCNTGGMFSYTANKFHMPCDACHPTGEAYIEQLKKAVVTVFNKNLTIQGLEEDLAQIIRVAWENPNNLLKFVKDNYPDPKKGNTK